MSDAVSIRLLGLASGGRSTLDGLWLVEYDPTRPGTDPAGRPMTAHVVCTADASQARRFADAREAHAYWTAESGRPYPVDRPLTAFNVSIEPAEHPSRVGD